MKAGQAGVAELVYALALGASGAIHESSNLSACTKSFLIFKKGGVKMPEASSLKEKAIIVKNIAKKLYPHNDVIFLAGPNEILDFEARREIRLLAEKGGAAILFFESPQEAVNSKVGMTASLEAYKEILRVATSDVTKVLAIVNHCVSVLDRAEFMRILFFDDYN